MTKEGKTSLNHLSPLSRGIGRGHRNGHGRVQVFFEPQDYNKSSRHIPRRLPAIPTDPRQTQDPPRETSQKDCQDFFVSGSSAAVPKTFTTRKGALLLFSEDVAEKLRGNTSKTNKKDDTSEGKSIERDARQEFEKLADFSKAILSYENWDSNIHVKFVKNSINPRPIRPGYSAKRYLSRLTRTFDDNFLESLLNKGIVCENTLFTTNSFLPHIRRRIDDDLSLIPSPYQLLHQMLIGPGFFSGFSFISERSDGTIILDPSECGSKEGEALQMVQIKDGVQTEVNYHELSQTEKENALADILVKSAIGQALEIHRLNLKNSAIEEESDEENKPIGNSVTARMHLKPWHQVNLTTAVKIYLRGSQTERLQRIPEDFHRKQDSIDQKSVSDDLYVSDSSATEDTPSFVSSRRSSLGFPATTFGSYRRSKTERKNENKTTTQPPRVMTPIIDSRVASREVTLNHIPVLPSIASKTTAIPDHNDPLPKSEELIFERMLKEERDRLSHMLTGVLKIGGLMQNTGSYDISRYPKRTHDGGPTVQSLGGLKGIPVKKTSSQKLASLKSSSVPVDGSVVMMPDGELIQIGQSMQRSERAVPNQNNGHSKRNTLKLSSRGSVQSDTELILRLAEGARSLATLVLSNQESGQDLKQDALKALQAFAGTAKLATSKTNEASVSDYKDMLAESLLNLASRLSGKEFESITKQANISPELMDSLLTRTVDPNEVTVTKDESGRSVITIIKTKALDLTPSPNKTKTKSIVAESGLLNGAQDEVVDKERSSAGTKLPGADGTGSSKSPSKQQNEGEAQSSLERSNANGSSDEKNDLEKLYVKLGLAGENADSSKKMSPKKKSKKKRKQAKKESGAEDTDQEHTDKDTDKEETEKSRNTNAESSATEMQEFSEDMELPDETWSDEDQCEPGRTYQSRSLAIKKKQRHVGEDDGDDEDLSPSTYFSDGSSVKSDLSRQNRATQREAKAEMRRQEVLRRRKEREEQLKLEKEEAERMERIAKELEEERLRKEETKRLELERLAEAKRRREEERLARERREEQDAERQRQMREEYLRNLEETRRREEEEARLQAEIEEKRRIEEEERIRMEQEMMMKLQEEERERLRRLQQEEEERLQRLEEEERERKLEEQRKALEEAMRLAQEMARKQEELQQRLEFNQSLHVESSDLSQAQSVSRAFVFSYLELVRWLGLDTSKNKGQVKYRKKANIQKS